VVIWLLTWARAARTRCEHLVDGVYMCGREEVVKAQFCCDATPTARIKRLSLRCVEVFTGL
jgi:hypothetical protein